MEIVGESLRPEIMANKIHGWRTRLITPNPLKGVRNKCLSPADGLLSQAHLFEVFKRLLDGA